jgi:hypothetical protein
MDPAKQQKIINQLYKEIYNFVLAGKKKAELQGKPYLFVLGEAHSITLGPSSLIVQRIFLHVAKELKIKNIFHEITADELAKQEERYNLASKHPDYKHRAIDFNIFLHAKQKFKHDDFKRIPLERTTNQPNEQREVDMAKVLNDIRQSGLVTAGTMHLKGICEDKYLKENFIIYPINTVKLSTLMLGKKEDSTEKVWLQNGLDFAANRKITKQFIVDARIVAIDVNLLIGIVDNAHNEFKKRQAQTIADKSKNSAEVKNPAAENTVQLKIPNLASAVVHVAAALHNEQSSTKQSTAALPTQMILKCKRC